MQIEWVRFDRERYNPQRLRRRASGRAGRHAAGRREPMQIFIALAAAQSAPIPDHRGRRAAARIQADQQISRQADPQPEHIRAVETEQSNSTALVDSDYVVKLYRKLEAGINPEIEIGRFLTEVAGFANTPALLGSVELVEGDQTQRDRDRSSPSSQNQGDGWTVTAAYLDRFVDEQRLLAGERTSRRKRGAGPLSAATCRKSEARRRDAPRARQQRRHCRFCAGTDRPEDVQRWIEDVAGRAERVFDALKQRRDAISGKPTACWSTNCSAQRARLRDRLSELLPPDIDGLNIRHHGDFHLGQMLIVKDDIFIIDFEGEPRRPLEERRRKAPAARDVAGLIRSIDYSATAALERALKMAPDEHGKLAARAGGLARSLDRGFPRRLSREHDRSRPMAGRSRRPPSGCWISFCSKRRSTRSSTSWPTGLIGCAFR